MSSKMLQNIEKVKNKTLTVESIVKSRLALLEKYKDYNSVIFSNSEEVLSQARALDAKIKSGVNAGCLCGAVITVKDNLDVKGLCSTAGMGKYRNNVSLADCSAVAKLRNEGAIILGKTNMPAGAMDMQTFNSIYGRTNHPDFPEYTCGGSSGGGSVSVKLGISDADIGNDFMGSIRVPAHFCGIYGIIGTEKVIPCERIVGGKPYGSTMSSILRIGIQASTLQDIDLLFQVLANRNKLFPGTAKNSSLKIAYTENSDGLPISKDYELVYQNYICSIKDNFLVEKISKNQFDFSKSRECFLKLLYGNMGISLPSIIRIMMGSKMSSKLKDYMLAEEEREMLINQLDILFDNYDILISPVTASPAFKHKKPIKMRGQQAMYDSMLIDDQEVSYSTANMGYTTPFSLTANPVIVVPIGKSKEGLPLGVQVVGNRFHDLKLIEIAKTIEKALYI
jgi:amidase